MGGEAVTASNRFLGETFVCILVLPSRGWWEWNELKIQNRSKKTTLGQVEQKIDDNITMVNLISTWTKTDSFHSICKKMWSHLLCVKEDTKKLSTFTPV